MTTRRRLKSVREAGLIEHKDFRRLMGYVLLEGNMPPPWPDLVGRQ
jgi:hypothetical protein